jgi:hypothetical protein
MFSLYRRWGISWKMSITFYDVFWSCNYLGFGQENRGQKLLNWILANISQVRLPLNLLRYNSGNQIDTTSPRLSWFSKWLLSNTLSYQNPTKECITFIKGLTYSSWPPGIFQAWNLLLYLLQTPVYSLYNIPPSVTVRANIDVWSVAALESW